MPVNLVKMQFAVTLVRAYKGCGVAAVAESRLTDLRDLLQWAVGLQQRQRTHNGTVAA